MYPYFYVHQMFILFLLMSTTALYGYLQVSIDGHLCDLWFLAFYEKSFYKHSWILFFDHMFSCCSSKYLGVKLLGGCLYIYKLPTIFMWLCHFTLLPVMSSAPFVMEHDTFVMMLLSLFYF